MTLQEIFENAEYKCFSYSGRGMYGRKCLAVYYSGSVGSLFAAVLDSYTPNPECNKANMIEAFEQMQTDNLGRDMVAYFPNIEYVENEYDCYTKR